MLVYVSHSRQNGAAALKLSERLDTLGAKTWLDLRELESGVDWKPKVAEAVRVVDAFLFLVGPPGPPDPLQHFEWQQITEEEYYLDPNKPMVSIVLGAAEVPGFLKARHAVHIPETGVDFSALAHDVWTMLSTPGATVDHEKLERGRAARRNALDNLKGYARDLEQDDVKRAGLRGLK
jgi:hypothetical protein